MIRKERAYEFLRKMKQQYGYEAVYSADEIANAIGATRANVSNDLNRLFEEERVEKLQGRPVRYRACATVITPVQQKESLSKKQRISQATGVFEEFIGYDGSVQMEVEKAKAAVLYPPHGLPMLIGGPTGSGKTMFAELIFQYAQRVGVLPETADFVLFNCADYAANPQLLTSQLFGYMKGAFTGAGEDRAGLVEKADNGILFLDEVHRLSSEAQEMLFYLIDFGKYRRLGEAQSMRAARPMIIMATTENPDSSLLLTFKRRIPVTVKLPGLSECSAIERLKIIEMFFLSEARLLKLKIQIPSIVVKALMAYECPGNMGQLKSDIKVICADAYVEYLISNEKHLDVSVKNLPRHVKEGIGRISNAYSDINLIASDMEIEPFSVDDESPKSVNIYKRLNERFTQYVNSGMNAEDIQTILLSDAQSYFANVLTNNNYKNYYRNVHKLLEIIKEPTMDLLEYAVKQIENECGLKLDVNCQITLALHLNSAIEYAKSGKTIQCHMPRKLQYEHPEILAVARRILDNISARLSVSFSSDEEEIVANLIFQMASMQNEYKCRIIVVCHGGGAAKAMANVANRLVGMDYVLWYDMSMDETPATCVGNILNMLSDIPQDKGYIFLVDMGSLLQIGDEIAKHIKVPIFTICNVYTSMVIEAALQAVEYKATPLQIYERIVGYSKGSSLELSRSADKPAARNKRTKVIVIACVAGFGAAEKLKQVIEKNFEMHSRVLLITIDIPSVEEAVKQIENLRHSYDPICVIGLDIGQPAKIPYISIQELILGDGIMKLADILKKYGINLAAVNKDMGDSGRQLIMSGESLSNYLNYLDGDKLAPFVTQAIERIEECFGSLPPSVCATLFIHIGCMVERLIFEPAGECLEDELSFALKPLMEAYMFKIPGEEYAMMHSIIMLSYKDPTV